MLLAITKPTSLFVLSLLVLISSSCGFNAKDEGISTTLPLKHEPCTINNNLDEIKSEGCGCNFIFTDLTDRLNGYLKFNLYINQHPLCKEYDLSNSFTKTDIDIVFEKTHFKTFCTDNPINIIEYISSESGIKTRTETKDGNEYIPISGKFVINLIDCKNLSLSIEDAILAYQKDTIRIPNFKSLNIDLSNYPG
jgi:hypothetical protein